MATFIKTLVLPFCVFILTTWTVFTSHILPHKEFIQLKSTKSAECPCNNISLCNNVQIEHEKELFGFVGSNNPLSSNISLYNWTYLTTIAWAPTDADDLLCTAHKHNVRLIAGTSNIPLTNNATERMIWIQQTFEQIQYYHFDGITFDIEGPMMPNTMETQQYVTIINETTIYFHSNMPGSQISVCVPWQSYLVNLRQLPYYELSLVSDLLYIMDYDTQSQNYQHQCLAAANAPFQGTQRGIQSYLNDGVDSKKLILGVPWYGYNYSCIMNEMESHQSKYCPIPFATFRGVNCSDAAGNEKTYAIINNLIDLNMNITDIRWDNSMSAPYFNYKDDSVPNQVYQIWFDNIRSLSMKYNYAKSMGLRGIGPFTFVQLYHTFSDEEMQRANTMWSAFDAFFH
eukprot:440989_1